MSTIESALREAIATLYAVKERLDVNNLSGEESPYIQDCTNAIEQAEQALMESRNRDS